MVIQTGIFGRHFVIGKVNMSFQGKQLFVANGQLEFSSQNEDSGKLL